MISNQNLERGKKLYIFPSTNFPRDFNSPRRVLISFQFPSILCFLDRFKKIKLPRHFSRRFFQDQPGCQQQFTSLLIELISRILFPFTDITYTKKEEASPCLQLTCPRKREITRSSEIGIALQNLNPPSPPKKNT